MRWTLGSSARKSELSEDTTKSNAEALCSDLFLASLYEQHFIKITCPWLIGQPPQVFPALS